VFHLLDDGHVAGDVRMSCVHFVEALPRNYMGKVRRDMVSTMISSISDENPIGADGDPSAVRENGVESSR
jgi:hypothetical protein